VIDSTALVASILLLALAVFAVAVSLRHRLRK
jgi:hypothetical protein